MEQIIAWLAFVGFGVIVAVIIILIEIRKYRDNKTDNGEKTNDKETDSGEKTYDNEPLKPPTSAYANYRYTKKPFLTKTERVFIKKLNFLSNYDLLVFPQIPLSSVVKKLGNVRYVTELFRTIDFGVFDSDYNCLALIELNDRSHNTYERQARDEKVEYICWKAGIPLITFYTYINYSDNEIKEKILNVIKQEALC